jgi:hypothetical protein
MGDADAKACRALKTIKQQPTADLIDGRTFSFQPTRHNSALAANV